MRLCILQAGEMNTDIAEGLPGYQDMYSALFADNALSVEVTFVMTLEGETAALDDYDAFLITAARAVFMTMMTGSRLFMNSCARFTLQASRFLASALVIRSLLTRLVEKR